ncbi:hypothetical protein OS187_06310 [Xanthomonadaceae bacterium JHOS43]|nr:hypothetical protein [Xanthomonadaceae bacterium JHOS43]
MKFAAILKSLLLLTAATLLAACGGGSSGGDSVFQPPAIRVAATPTATTVQSGQFIDIAVRVTQANGANVSDGTTVNSTVTPASNGSLQTSSNGVLGGTSGGTVGGIVNFRFTGAGAGGSTTLTFSVPDPSAPGRAISTTVNVNVTPAPDTSLRISATPEVTTLPAHTSTDITVRVTKADGSLAQDGTVVRAVATPATAGVVAAFGGGEPEVTTVAGIARFTFTAGASAGTSTVRFTTENPDNASEVTSTEVTFTITDGPRYIIQVQPATTTLAAYTATDVTVTVRNANGGLVPDGTIVNAVATPANAGTITAVGGGAPDVGTVAGISRFTFTAGASVGTSTVTFSVTDPGNPSQASTAQAEFTITDGPSLLIEIQPAATNVRQQSRTDVVVRVRQASGAIVPDGTVVSGVVVPDSRGLIMGSSSGEPDVATVGGVANFAFIAGTQPGPAEVQFSVVNEASGEVVTASTTFSIDSAPGRRMTVQLLPDTIPLNGRADIRIEVLEADGRPVADGTVINGLAFPGSYGALDKTSDQTLAGVAAFQYQAQSLEGPVDLIFSATVGDAGNQPVVGKARLQIAGTDENRLRLEATRTTLPVNHFAVLPFLGSPYMAEVVVTVKDSNGQPVNMEDGIQVSINPVGDTGGFSTLDDPETECDLETLDGCEFLIRMGQAPVDIVAGKATVFVHSLNFAAATTLTVTTQDPVSGNTIAAALDFTIVGTTPQTPTQLTLGTPSAPIYVQGSGGNDSGMLQVGIADALGQQVPDPESGATAYNNYRLEIVGANAEQSPRLSGIDASGATVTGSQIDLRTTAGIGGANFIAGDGVGSFVVRLTADRADNNVDNGISDPVVLERSVVVSDGRLFDLEITQPTVNVLTINPSGGEIEVVDLGSGEVAIPISPDGTYSVTVGVIATDRLGNPVLPGTVIRFGLIDEPQTLFGAGDFYIAGGDGDPQEGGTLFTAAFGEFTTAGGGVGPGDTLVVMAENVIGNRDMESARTVTEVHSQTSLSVDYRFNHNDTTGQSVDYQGILPYIIGRAADGNIVASAATNEIGVATTKMNYPVEKLGKTVVIWAQGDGPVVAGQPKKVTDVEFARFSAIAPAMLVVSPSVLPANSTHQVQICAYDALGAPIGNVPVDFAFQGLAGQGWVDDVSMSGTVGNPTLLGSGCTTAIVRTQGMLEGDAEPELVFTGAGAQATVTFSFQPMVLLATPTSIRGGGGVVTLTLVNNNGVPLPGHQIVGTCEGSEGVSIWLSPIPGVTNGNGQTTTTIRVDNLNQFGSAGSGSCTFQTVDGSASATVTLLGEDLCLSYVSPLPPECPVEPVEQVALTITMDIPSTPDATTGGYTISGNAGVGCTVPLNTGAPLTGVACDSEEFDEGTVVTLTAGNSNLPWGATFHSWEGTGCIATSASPRVVQVVMSEARHCKAIWVVPTP